MPILSNLTGVKTPLKISKNIISTALPAIYNMHELHNLPQKGFAYSNKMHPLEKK